MLVKHLFCAKIVCQTYTYAYPQSIFFIKRANERHDKLQITNAPITLGELAPTIAQITTGEYSYLGYNIYDFEENELRERVLRIGTYDENYPAVKRYDGTPVEGNNVFRLYTYTGGFEEYPYQYENDIFTLTPAADSYY